MSFSQEPILEAKFQEEVRQFLDSNLLAGSSPLTKVIIEDMHKLARKGNFEIIIDALKELKIKLKDHPQQFSIFIDSKGVLGYGLLHSAFHYLDGETAIQTLRELLALGADPNLQIDYPENKMVHGDTLLHMAYKIAIIRRDDPPQALHDLLVQYGADIKIKNINGASVDDLKVELEDELKKRAGYHSSSSFDTELQESQSYETQNNEGRNKGSGYGGLPPVGAENQGSKTEYGGLPPVGAENQGSKTEYGGLPPVGAENQKSKSEYGKLPSFDTEHQRSQNQKSAYGPLPNPRVQEKTRLTADEQEKFWKKEKEIRPYLTARMKFLNGIIQELYVGKRENTDDYKKALKERENLENLNKNRQDLVTLQQDLTNSHSKIKETIGKAKIAMIEDYNKKFEDYNKKILTYSQNIESMMMPGIQQMKSLQDKLGAYQHQSTSPTTTVQKKSKISSILNFFSRNKKTSPATSPINLQEGPTKKK